MNKLPKIVLCILLFCAAFVWPSRAHAAARIFFDPTSASVAQNNEFTVQLKIDAQANQIIGSDAIVTYAAADLDVTSVTNGGYFSEFSNANNTSGGRIEIHGYVTSTYNSKTGAGTLATITFKSKKTSGSSAITITCSGSGNDTIMLNATGQNILSCTQVNQIAVSYSGGGSSTNTPTPTGSGGTGGSGNTNPTCSSLVTDISTAVGTPLPVSLTCAGSDANGNINAAEFIFGDGTTQVVEKNVGGSGSITTTHTYTTIGSLGASCRVRDNNGVWSSIPDSCKKVISIKPRLSPTPTPTRIVTNRATGYITPTPTQVVVSMISITPEPPYLAELTPTLYPQDDNTDGSENNRFWWIVGGAIALISAFFLLRRKKNPPTPPIPISPPPTQWQQPPVPPQTTI